MLPSAQTYATWLAVFRIYTGVFWLAHGIPKLLNPHFFGPNGMMTTMITQSSADTSGFYHTFLQTVVLPNAALVSHLVAWGETLTGVSLLLGLLTRLGGVVGMFLPLNYFLMKGSFAVTGLGGMDISALALSFVSVALPTGLIWGIDGAIKASRAKQPVSGAPASG
jgi:uncharacterized membrane protein YphA (DoxX/SURF4 family)